MIQVHCYICKSPKMLKKMQKNRPKHYICEECDAQMYQARVIR